MTVSFIDQHILQLITKYYLQQDLDTLRISWAEAWQMQFNVNKSSILQLSKHHHKNLFPYSMSGKLLKTVEQHSYLGIQIEHHLSWNAQVDLYAARLLD